MIVMLETYEAARGFADFLNARFGPECCSITTDSSGETYSVLSVLKAIGTENADLAALKAEYEAS